MRTTTSISEAHAAVGELQRGGKTVGFVPTLGALHAGHQSMIDAARRRCDAVVVSIFVNPTQFAPGEDYAKYPRTPEADLDLCRKAGVDLIFAPSVETMYPAGAVTKVHVSGLTEGLCGGHRPGHFDGVTTAVAKLFNIVPADMAFFGEKDYQQLKVIERMVRDLNIAIEIVPCPTVRESNGLAISSRNAYLSPIEHEQALSLSRAMQRASEAIDQGTREAKALIELMETHIRSAGDARIDYISIVDPETLHPVDQVVGPARICLAVRIGKCRLIDNLAVDAAGAGG